MPSHPAFDWPDIPATLTPLAFTRGPEPGRLVPVYPPGLPLMMAPLTWIHGLGGADRRREHEVRRHAGVQGAQRRAGPDAGLHPVVDHDHLGR